MLGKAVDDTDYEAKIKELEKEIKKERAQFREKDKKKVEEHKKHNYGAEYREFAEKQLETLDYRVKLKKEQKVKFDRKLLENLENELLQQTYIIMNKSISIQSTDCSSSFLPEQRPSFRF